MTECKECQQFYAYENICLRDNSKCYENGKCLHIDCEKFEVGTWGIPEADKESKK